MSTMNKKKHKTTEIGKILYIKNYVDNINIVNDTIDWNVYV